MARKRGPSPLYEAINKTRHKSGADKELPVAPPPVDTAPQADLATVKWPRKPKTLVINAGRIELSLPIAVAITAGLVIILLILGAYRLGQRNGTTGIANMVGFDGFAEEAEPATIARPPAAVSPANPGKTDFAAGKSSNATGGNVIVLAQYQTRTQLEPPMRHFVENGIETEIVAIGNNYFLVTKNRYANPDRPGTDGYAVKQKITQIGRNYKAPAGYESFAPHFFSDAYGKKIN